MTVVDELKDRFYSLTDEDKMAFMKAIMPSFCESFRKNPESMMMFCGDMMKSSAWTFQGGRAYGCTRPKSYFLL